MVENRPEQRLEKYAWIADLVAGKSFADIGGLWGTVNETVTIAARAGASETTMVDIQPEGSKWWQAFHDRCAEEGVSGYNCRVFDICDFANLDDLGKFDIVHCAGILYHVSDPVALLRNISYIAREYFIIGSMLIPEEIDNEAGQLKTPRGTSRCVPLLGECERRIIARHFSDQNITIGGINGPTPVFVESNSYQVRTGPWWYLFTAETMQAMCTLCGADIVKTATTRQGAQNILCRKRTPTK